VEREGEEEEEKEKENQAYSPILYIKKLVKIVIFVKDLKAFRAILIFFSAHNVFVKEIT